MDKAKTTLSIIFTLSVIAVLISVFVLAAGTDKKPVKVLLSSIDAKGSQPIGFSPDRVIAPTVSAIDRIIFKLKGCTILHSLNDATALNCPEGVSIKGARPDRIFHSHDLEADVQINADDVWALGFDGSGVKVAILDTGVDNQHIELSDSIIKRKNFVKGVSGLDVNGHGTHVSGIVTANGVFTVSGNKATGVAPGAGIIVGKVCGDNGCFESDIMKGIEWAVAQSADVLSLSLGGGNFGSHCDSDPLAAKVNWAVSQGLVTTISSGNDGAGVSSPACASGAIAVGAVDKFDVRPSWSNFGSALDLVAPGVDILSTYSCIAAGSCGFYWYAWMSGTSMSAPHVAGTAALILQKNPGYTVNDVKDALYNTAVDLGTAGFDNYFGHGRVDALGAVTFSPTPECTVDSDCNDGLHCNGVETCQAGVCQAGTSVDCSGLNDQCNVGVCDEATDSCVKQTANEGLSCNDGLFCNVGETCQSGSCAGGSANDCSDGNSCTTDSCDEAVDSCVYTPIPDCSPAAVCGDNICAGEALGETCSTCSADCPSKIHPKKGLVWCCGDGICSGKGENVDSCPVDCA